MCVIIVFTHRCSDGISAQQETIKVNINKKNDKLKGNSTYLHDHTPLSFFSTVDGGTPSDLIVFHFPEKANE